MKPKKTKKTAKKKQKPAPKKKKPVRKPKKHPPLVHTRENNPDSERHLRENTAQFENQCRLVLSLLKRGFILTSRKAMIEYDIGDLHRRILDLKGWGIKTIKWDWVKSPNGKRTKYKRWYIPTYSGGDDNIRKPAKDIATQLELELVFV